MTKFGKIAVSTWKRKILCTLPTKRPLNGAKVRGLRQKHVGQLAPQLHRETGSPQTHTRPAPEHRWQSYYFQRCDEDCTRAQQKCPKFAGAEWPSFAGWRVSCGRQAAPPAVPLFPRSVFELPATFFFTPFRRISFPLLCLAASARVLLFRSVLPRQTEEDSAILLSVPSFVCF